MRNIRRSREDALERFRKTYLELVANLPGTTGLAEKDRQDIIARCEALVVSNRITENSLTNLSFIFQIIINKIKEK